MAAPSGLAFGDNLGLTLQSIKPPSAAADGIDDKKDIRALELSETVKREMAGGQQHTYQINLNAHQFLKAIVEQDGIDVIRQVSGPDGKRLMEFDSESSLQGREEVRLVAEVTGSYQLIVRPQLGSVSDASYQIRIVELRIAAESDRALQDAHKLCEESTKLFNAGKGNEALPLLERALEIRENILEPNHRDIAFTIHSLAALYFDKSDYTKAEPLFQRALAIREKAWGPENYALAEPLNGLGDLYRHRGDCAKAEPPYMRALALTKKTLGPETPDFVKYLNGLALLYAAKGDIARAVEFRAQSNAVGERSLALHLAYGSERQKLAYLALFAKETDITLSLHNQIAPDNPQALDLAFTTLLRRKGRGLDAMTDTIATLRRRATSEDQSLLDQTALKQSMSPRILHIATHGFFLSDEAAAPAEIRGASDENPLRLPIRLSKRAAKIDNPLLRSGLALAGANERRSGDDDGVLTSLEAASLDLWGTKLVVLSGCATGVGEVKNGEGVYGLRRALALAGAETQVMSLWPVWDKETPGMMAGYYRRLLKGEGRGEALRQMQLEMLKDAKLRHPHYWGNFIQTGEWANLDGRR